MGLSSLSKATSTLVAALHVYISLFAVLPGIALGQGVDVDPPVIELQAVEEGVRGDTQVFTATITDNNIVSSATLFYRFGSQARYSATPMAVIQGTDIYTASIDTADTSSGVIQYYLEAKDPSANRTVQGFAFDPLERVLVDTPTVATTATQTDAAASSGLSTNKRVIYGVLGLVALGALASLAGGSSGGGSGADEVDVVIRVDKFQ